MNHRCSRRKFGRYRAHRMSMLYNLALSIIKHEQIKTTLPKAKEVRPIVERMITLGKKDGLNARRLLISKIGDCPEVKKIFNDLSARYANRQGGYTRIIRTGHRLGDCAPTAVIQLVDSPYADQDSAEQEYRVIEDTPSKEPAPVTLIEDKKLEEETDSSLASQ